MPVERTASPKGERMSWEMSKDVWSEKKTIMPRPTTEMLSP